MSISRHQAVGAYRRWDPPSFDEAAASPIAGDEAASAADAPARDEPAPLPAEDFLPADFQLPTADDIERMHEEARASGRAEGYAEGHAAGLEAGRTAGYAESKALVEEQARRLQTLADNFDRAMTGLDTEVADELLSLSIEIARQVLQHSLAVKPDGVLETVRAALAQLPQVHAQIRLHPADLAITREHLGEQLGHSGHRLIEDDTLARGGCRIEAANAHVDATMQTRWRRVLETLGREDASWDPED